MTITIDNTLYILNEQNMLGDLESGGENKLTCTGKAIRLSTGL
jgi:hypothetical protein